MCVSVICKVLYNTFKIYFYLFKVFPYIYLDINKLECGIRTAVYFCPNTVFPKLNHLNPLIPVNSFKIGS